MGYDLVRFRDERLARGWSRKDLALAAGISEQTVGRIERGRQPRPHTALAIARALGLPLRDLIVPERGSP